MGKEHVALINLKYTCEKIQSGMEEEERASIMNDLKSLNSRRDRKNTQHAISLMFYTKENKDNTFEQ